MNVTVFEKKREISKFS